MVCRPLVEEPPAEAPGWSRGKKCGEEVWDGNVDDVPVALLKKGELDGETGSSECVLRDWWKTREARLGCLTAAVQTVFRGAVKMTVESLLFTGCNVGLKGERMVLLELKTTA